LCKQQIFKKLELSLITYWKKLLDCSNVYLSYLENQPKLPYNANRSEEIQTNETYTLTYPSEMQSNVNRMINCFVSLKKIENKTISAYEIECQNNGVSSKNKIKLKCGVCCLEFNNFDHLLEHKEQNLSCKNDVQIFDEFEQNSLIVKKSKRKKKDFSLLLSNHQNKFGSSSDFKRTNSKKNSIKSSKDVNNNNYYRDEDLDDDDGQMRNSKDNGVKVSNVFKNSNNNNFFSENDTNNTADSSTMNDNEEIYFDLEDENYAFKSNEDENHNGDDKIIDDEDEFEKCVNPKIRRPYMRQKGGSSNNLTCESKI
jgi:hypothetical protein